MALNREYLLMEIQQQNEKQLTPWNHDEELPRNIIIQFQSTKKQIHKTQLDSSKRIQSPLSVGLQRFLQRRHRATIKLSEKKQENSLSPTRLMKIQITNLQPETLHMNETMRLSDAFPSYDLKKEAEKTFYKPQRYHSIHSGQQENFRFNLLRKSFQTPQKQQNSNILTRNFTSKKVIHSFASQSNKKEHSQSLEKRIKIEADPLHRQKFSVALKSTNNDKHYKYQQIMELIEKKEKQKTLQRSKTEPDEENIFDKCLKSKKQLFVNLPKIQFIEVCK